MSLHTTGYLYFNTRRLPLDAMLEDATRAFHAQYGLDQPVNFAVVNPSLLPEGKTRKGGVDVTATNTILPSQCWIGHAPRRSPQVMIPEPADSSDAAALEVPVPGLNDALGRQATPQPGLLAPGHEIQAPGCSLPIGRNLAALVASEQRPAPALALPAPNIPLLPAPSAWSAVQRTRERQDLTNLLHNMKATRQEFLAAMDLHSAGAHVTLTRLVRHVPAWGTSFPYDNSRSEGYRAAIKYLETVLAERKRRDQRQRRMADLVARFQLEYEQLHPAMQDYIIPSTGQVVRRPPVIALPGVISEAVRCQHRTTHPGFPMRYTDDRAYFCDICGERFNPALEPPSETAAAQGAQQSAAILAEEPTTLSDHQLLKAIQHLDDLHMEATGKRKALQGWIKREIWRYSMRLPEKHPRRKLWQNYKPQPAQVAPVPSPADMKGAVDSLTAQVADQLRPSPVPPNPPPDASPILCWYHLPLKDPELRHLGHRAKQFERETGRKPQRIEVPTTLWSKLGHPRNWQGIPIYELREGEHARSNRHGAAFSAGPTSARSQYARPAAAAAGPARVAGL